MVAAQYGHTAVTRALLGTDQADVDAQSNASRTALMYASENCHSDVVSALLDAGVDPAIRDSERCTALHLAAVHRGVETCRRLVAGGAEVDCQTAHGYSALMWAAHAGSAELVRLLLHTGQVDVSLASTDGGSARQLAQDRGFTDVVTVLDEHVRASTVEP